MAVATDDPIAKRFEGHRKMANQRAEANRQNSQDALKRRFASMGALNTGSAIKAQQLADQSSAQQKEQAMLDIDSQEQAAREVQANRDFQAGEAEKQRSFAAGEAEKQRSFTGKQADIDRVFQDKVFNFDKESKLKQLDLQAQDLSLRREENEFNKRLARYQAGQTGGLFGSGGFLGTGIGAGPSDI